MASNPNQISEDERLARQLQEQEQHAAYAQGGMPMAGGAAPVMGMPVQGMPVQGQVVHGQAVQGTAVPGQPMPGQPGTMPMTYGMVQPGGNVVYVTELGPGPMLSEEEILVLQYRFSMVCFATIDAFFTLLNAVTSLVALTFGEEQQESEAKKQEDAAFGMSEESSRYVGLASLIFLAGPVCGYIGAKNLQRNLVAVYVAFCFVKMIWHTIVAFISGHFWLLLVALIQIWITTIVYRFFRALSTIAPDRCKELLDPTMNGTVPRRVVLW